MKRGTVYLGHIPHGFYEKEMKGYFSQFGKVTRLKLFKSKKVSNNEMNNVWLGIFEGLIVFRVFGTAKLVCFNLRGTYTRVSPSLFRFF